MFLNAINEITYIKISELPLVEMDRGVLGGVVRGLVALLILILGDKFAPIGNETVAPDFEVIVLLKELLREDEDDDEELECCRTMLVG